MLQRLTPLRMRVRPPLGAVQCNLGEVAADAARWRMSPCQQMASCCESVQGDSPAVLMTSQLLRSHMRSLTWHACQAPQSCVVLHGEGLKVSCLMLERVRQGHASSRLAPRSCSECLGQAYGHCLWTCILWPHCSQTSTVTSLTAKSACHVIQGCCKS